MLYRLKGELIHTDTKTAVIDCGGVAYRCITTLNTLRRLPPTGKEAVMYTYLHVGKDTLGLYGFYDLNEMDFYKMLTGVSGVGPKMGISILSEFTPDKAALCIASGDAKTLTKAAGVGMKLAQRIVLELKDKIKGFDTGSDGDGELAGIASVSGNASEAIDALVSLGYPQSDAAQAIARMDPALPVEELIKKGLRALARID